ncbi:hypothetical protein B0H17DRAFT_1095711 [Mycena rosella]|uniref:Uncharacterized protein n=1 Tax=Mycena rosella TaxID=1033263 RepID=A0AAD7G683_MYCRO|nr:hypothetical protein B0H17DRAFT_1095711 [Mycena rosella]
MNVFYWTAPAVVCLQLLFWAGLLRRFGFRLQHQPIGRVLRDMTRKLKLSIILEVGIPESESFREAPRMRVRADLEVSGLRQKGGSRESRSG